MHMRFKNYRNNNQVVAVNTKLLSVTSFLYLFIGLNNTLVLITPQAIGICIRIMPLVLFETITEAFAYFKHVSYQNI